MSSNKGFSDDELSDAKPWDLPFVEQPEKPQDKDKTNALNFRSDWKYEPPEEEEAEITCSRTLLRVSWAFVVIVCCCLVTW